ncbi:MAG TPA: 16S rRNA (uracil(1498)-N(3))-methyltransferase [Holophagaceae bacterium]|nr:16S rRNA (uracil(1498)-N(3))-methyltransferase [Holophagaceae bacterium]
MSLPRFFLLDHTGPVTEGSVVRLNAEATRHLKALRLRPGNALELVLPHGVWRCDLAVLERDVAEARLVAPLDEEREPAIALEGWLPLTAQLGLWDEWLPPLVELGITRIIPVAYGRSEYDVRKTAAKRERWERLILAACEQSHRNRVPVLAEPVPFEALRKVEAPQKWVAYELPTGEANPRLGRESLAFTSGPEGGISDEEFAALRKAGWVPVSLGRSILRAVTTPAALLGAVQFQLQG